jgi:hypothetical protein
MISASDNLKDIFYKNTNVEIGTGCYIEYNMNEMIDAVYAENNIADSAYTDQILQTVTSGNTTVTQPGWPPERPNPYKKLFPIDSLIKPFRPTMPGVKYYVMVTGDTLPKSFSPARSVSYPTNQPRIYYPGADNFYKYWLTPKNTGVNVKINYATSGNLYALTNKIVVKFEKTHSLPSTYTVSITKSDNTNVIVADALSTPSDGIVNLYYNGTSWSVAEPSEPIIYPDPISIKSITLTTPSAGATKIIGVIEISAKWIKDISPDIVSFDISKESSSSSEDILPVGKIVSQSLILNLSKYNESSLQYKSYKRTDILSNSINYIIKFAKLYPYFKIYHSNGAITEGSKKYDKVLQGHYYIDSWSIGDYGDASITALDSSKYLMDTTAPDMLCEFYPVTAIIRRLLDSVGFTNYAFNLTSDTDSSIPLINYFWTDGSKTIWESLQELCRDIQMNAVVDENNILQFYSRNYMYASRSKNWNFYYDKDNDTNRLANIIDFSQKDIASANEVRVTWSTPISSNYLGSSGPLWQAPTSFLIAGGLKDELSPTNDKVVLDLQTPDKYSRFQTGFNFNGYFLIDSEIIEFDAIGYQYVPRNPTNTQVTDVLKGTVLDNGINFINLWIENSNDLGKYRNFCKQSINSDGSDTYLKPNGVYRVKTRGALGTKAATHYSSGAPTSKYPWTGVMITKNA